MVICPGGKGQCPADHSCCLDWSIDQIHCCPLGYSCDQGTCVVTKQELPAVLLSTSTAEVVKCNQHSACPERYGSHGLVTVMSNRPFCSERFWLFLFVEKSTFGFTAEAMFFGEHKILCPTESEIQYCYHCHWLLLSLISLVSTTNHFIHIRSLNGNFQAY